MGRDYREVSGRIRAVCDGEDDAVALMATMACELRHGLRRLRLGRLLPGDRAGAPEDRPVPGRPRLPDDPLRPGRLRRRRARAPDPGGARTSTPSPATSPATPSTRSEIVVPVLDRAGALIAVLDVDSDTPAAFDEADAAALEGLVGEIFARRDLR